MSTSRVIVVGGGYAGVMAANRLLTGKDVEVALVNPRPTFVDRIRLHQLVGGSAPAVRPYAEVLNERVRLVVDTVESIDAGARTVTLGTGRQQGYHYLIYAVGSRSAHLGVPGASEHTFPLAELEQAERLRARLAELPMDAPVTVVGGGPTGIEISGELAEAGRRVTLVTGRLGAVLSERGRRSTASALRSLSVTLLDGATVAEVEERAVRLGDGTHLSSAVTIWTTGFATPDLAATSGLATDAAGRLLTDETLTSISDPRILAAGDAADPSAQPLRMSCQAAIPLGLQAAETVLSRLADRRPRAIDSGFNAVCLSVGRTRGIFQPTHADDSARSWDVPGRPGAWVKESICRAVAWGLTVEARHPGRMMWTHDRSRADRVVQARADQTEAA